MGGSVHLEQTEIPVRVVDVWKTPRFGPHDVAEKYVEAFLGPSYGAGDRGPFPTPGIDWRHRRHGILGLREYRCGVWAAARRHRRRRHGRRLASSVLIKVGAVQDGSNPSDYQKNET